MKRYLAWGLFRPLFYMILTVLFFAVIDFYIHAQGFDNPINAANTANRGTNTGSNNGNSPDNRDYRNTLDIRKQADELYLNWLRLAILGKDQIEIEEYFKENDPVALESVKESLRRRIIYKLEGKGLHTRGRNFTDTDDIRVSVRMIRQTIRAVSMEHDNEVLYRIKERFGINPYTLDQIAYQLQ